MVPAVVVATHVMGLGVIRSLGIMGIPVIAVSFNRNDMGQYSRYVLKRFSICHPEEEAQGFIAALIQLSRPDQRMLLIPADDAPLLVISKYKKELEKYFAVAANDWNITKQCLDKNLTYDAAKSIDVDIPKTIPIRTPDDLAAAKNEVRFPCLLKPRFSHAYYDQFKKKMAFVRNMKELDQAYQEAQSHSHSMVLQEFVVGPTINEYNYNSYVHNNQTFAEFTARKIRMGPTEDSFPRVVESIDVPEIKEKGKLVLQKIGFQGYSCMEFKKDIRDNRYKLMEVNGRFNRSLLLCTACGVNFPWIMYQQMVNNIAVSQNQMKKKIFWIDMTNDFYKSIKYFKTEKQNFMSFLKPYFHTHVDSIFDIRDLQPFIRRLLTPFTIILHKFPFFRKENIHKTK